MHYRNIVFRVLTIVCFLVLTIYSYKIAEESELIYNNYQQIFNTIAEKECYNTYEESLQIDMLKISDKITYHSVHGYNNWMIVCAVTAVIFVMALFITILEIKRGK